MPSNNVAPAPRRSGRSRAFAFAVFVASLTSVLVVGAAAAPSAAVRAASRCSAAADAVDCLLRAAAAGVHALARSAEPVDLVPGCVTLVKGAVAVADSDTSSSLSAEAALVRSVAAFVGSRAITVRAPVRLLDSLERTLAEGKPRQSVLCVRETG